MGLRITAIMPLLTVISLSIAQAAEENTPVALSHHPQLFLDDYLVKRMENVRRVIQHPVKHPDNPLIVRDQPWEKRMIEIYGTVLYEPGEGLFRCWYLGNEYNNGIPDNPEHPRTAEYFTCYAESEDGVHWAKPLVGPKPFGIHERHNIVIEGTHGFCVLPTPGDSDPNRRYKGVGGPVFGFSPDGIHWDVRNWRDTIGKNDTSSCVVRWNGEYLAYVRAQVEDPDWSGVMRGVGLSVSQDFEHWTPKRTIFTTDAEDGYPWTQPYGVAVTPYGDVLIGILWLLHLDHVPGNNSLGDQDTQLMVSRDGRNWNRVADRAVFLDKTPGAWDCARVFPGTTMFVKDDVVYIYYTGVAARHGEGGASMAIGLATLSADRFVGVERADAGADGIVETRLLQCRGSDLLVNADADGLRVELLDGEGQVIPGFDREACRLLPNDKLRYRVAWGDGDEERTLAAIANQGPFAIRFVLGGGMLFAFQIVDD